MNSGKRSRWVFFLVFTTIFLFGCGSGQFLGSTATPDPTSTPLYTSTPLATPTNTPLSFEPILIANGFEYNAGQTCPEGPCKTYYNMYLFMVATVFDTGRFVLERYLVTPEINQEQGPVYLEIINSIYPPDIADAILRKEDNGGSGNSREFPYEGEINGYKYEVFMTYSEQIGTDELVVSVTPIE